MELNVTVLRGRLSSVPEVRVLPSGAAVATLSLRAPLDGRTTSVPVTVWDPAAWIADLDVDDELLVLGGVRRRFFRSAGGTGSRVDVEASFVAQSGKRQLAAFARRIRELLGDSFV